MTERIVTDANGRKYITTEPLPAKIIDYEAAYYALQKKIGFDRADIWLKRINDAVLAEREACAKVCETDGIGAKYQGDVYAEAIRART
jgi:hypothetical protein